MYSRERTKGQLVTEARVGTRVLTAFNGGKQTTSSTPALVSASGSEYTVMKDREVHGFRKRSARGETFVNPLYQDTLMNLVPYSGAGCQSSRITPLYAGESSAAWKACHVSDLAATYRFAGSEYPTDEEVDTIRARNASARDVAWNRALSNVVKTDALLLVTAAEARKTLAMVGGYVRRFDQLFQPLTDLEKSRARKGKRLTSAQLAQELSAEWLRIRYGVLTTAYEVEGVLKALDRGKSPERVTARATETYADSVYVGSTGNGGMYGTTVWGREIIANGTVRAGLLYEPDVSLEKHLGLHISAIPVSAFELVRFSFVANWFMDLQETLTGLTAFVHGKMLVGWITEELILQCHRTITVSPVATNLNVPVGGVSKPTTWTHEAGTASLTTGRRVRTRVEVSGMVPTMPSIRVNLTPARVVDALALLTTRLSRINRHVRL